MARREGPAEAGLYKSLLSDGVFVAVQAARRARLCGPATQVQVEAASAERATEPLFLLMNECAMGRMQLFQAVSVEAVTHGKSGDRTGGQVYAVLRGDGHHAIGDL